MFCVKGHVAQYLGCETVRPREEQYTALQKTSQKPLAKNGPSLDTSTACQVSCALCG